MHTLNLVWNDVVNRKMYVTGGCGALYDGASPDGAKDQKSITRVHQAYGRNYQLPNATAHNETCANIGNAMWNWRMFLVTGGARFMDVAELALYNSVLSGGSLDGMIAAYQKLLPELDDQVKVVPGRGRAGTKKDMEDYLGVMLALRERVGKLIRDGKTMEEAVAQKPTADLDPKWGNGPIRPDQIVEEVYADLKRKAR